MLFRRLGALLAAFTIGCIPLIADAADPATTTAPTPGMTGAVIDAQAQSDALRDIPANSWAYQAIQALVADGIIIGYPDGTFKGNRPLTRYEAAVLTERAVEFLTKKLANPQTAGDVSQADIDKLRALLDEFRGDIDALKLRVSDIEGRLKKVEATQSAMQAQDNRAKVGLVYFIRPGSFTEEVSAYKAATGCGSNFCGVALAPNTALTGGSLGSGDNVTANKYYSGSNGTGFGYQLLRLLLDGQLDSRASYHIRLENRYYWDTPDAQLSSSSTFGGTVTNTPNYLTSTTSTFDYPTNTSIRLNYAYMQYNDPSGVYVAGGRINEADGTLGMLYADQFNGASVGYSKGGIKIEGAYAYQWPVNNAGGQVCSTTTICNYATQQLLGQASFAPTKSTLLGVAFADDVNDRITSWNPTVCSVTGKAPVGGYCATSSAANAPIVAAGLAATGAYQAAVTNLTEGAAFGRYASSIDGVGVSLEAEATVREGHDPFTNLGWKSNAAYWIQGKLGAYSPTPFRSYLEGGWIAAGFNSIDPHTSIINGTSYDGEFQGDPNGYQIGYAGIHYWFSTYARVGLVYQYYDLLNGTTYPVASATCPGCFLTHDLGQAVFLQTWLQF
jgi:hypothetical protein